MRKIIIPILVFASLATVSAQPSMEKADRFMSDSLGKLVLNRFPSVKWIDGGSRYFSYTDQWQDGSTCHWLVDTRDWKRTGYQDEESIKEAISSLTGADSAPKGKPGNQQKTKRGDRSKGWSSDSLYYISAINDDIWLFRSSRKHAGDTARIDTNAADSIRLSNDGEHFFSFSLSGNSEAGAAGRSGASGRWIGGSHRYVVVREDKRKVGSLTLVNSLSSPRPKAKTYRFPMPGDKEVPSYEVYVIDADSSKMTRIDIDCYKDQSFLLPRFSRYPHTDRYAYLLRINRTRDTLDLCRIDTRDKTVKILIREECSPHLNEQLFSWHLLNDGKEILWWSERTGKGKWYLYDGEGKLKKALTPDRLVAGSIRKIDTLGRSIIYEGYGGEDGINPHYCLYYRSTFDGKTNLLTPGNGNHEINFSPDGKYISDTYSRMDMAPHYQICDMKGKVRFEMEPADVSRLHERGWREPEVIEVTAADSTTRLYGIVYLPFDIQPGQKYPIISNVYPGPQTDLTPQSFCIDDDCNQSLAQLGFIVIKFSYRGSCPVRGREFYNYGYGNLRDYPLDDDYAVIRQIAERYPFADLDRVGIYGHSGGGFMSAAAMLTRPDFYKVGISASGNHDNNIYTQWWGESFHGPTASQDGSGQYECRIPTNIELVGNLNGRLLLITGDMDNNVHPANTFRMADALIKNGKRFDMLVIPGADHGLGDIYYINIIRYYFVEHLLGMPQKDIDIIRHK